MALHLSIEDLAYLLRAAQDYGDVSDQLLAKLEAELRLKEEDAARVECARKRQDPNDNKLIENFLTAKSPWVCPPGQGNGGGNLAKPKRVPAMTTDHLMLVLGLEPTVK